LFNPANQSAEPLAAVLDKIVGIAILNYAEETVPDKPACLVTPGHHACRMTEFDCSLILPPDKTAYVIFQGRNISREKAPCHLPPGLTAN
jgi:hypothetical protein